VYNGITMVEKVFEGYAVGEVSRDKLYALGGQLRGFGRTPDQCANLVTLFQ
jgi:hypothetical protein